MLHIVCTTTGLAVSVAWEVCNKEANLERIPFGLRAFVSIYPHIMCLAAGVS